MEPDTLPPENKMPDEKNADTEILNPTTLTLRNQCIYETSPQSQQQETKPLYQINNPITTTSPSKPFTSAKFERVEHTTATTTTTTNKHLFYLAHPAHARYRTDTPAYYLTSASRGMIGNVHFETEPQKGKKKRPGFTALLTPGRSASDHPLFCNGNGDDGKERCQVLFTANPLTKWTWTWKGKGKGKGGYTWTDYSGAQVAVEEETEGMKKGEGERKLVITVPMRRELRDVLVALWLLRVWFETAESKRARREALESMMPPPTSTDMKLIKRTGALGGVAAGGGC